MYSQSAVIDSVRKKLSKEKHDTSYLKDLNELAWQFLELSSDSSNKYVQLALKEAKTLQFLDGEIDAKNTLGIFVPLQRRIW